MKKTVFFILVVLVGIQLNGFGQIRRDGNKAKADTVSIDSLEYRLIIEDPGFDTWLLTQPSKDFYSKDYYEQKNRIYVSEWNFRYLTAQNGDKYETYIDYNPNTDYDLDLNYKLYYYFKYFEETNKVKLYPTGR